MSTKALIGILLAGTIGILIFLFVHLSGGSNKITIGSGRASACDRAKHADDCLPDVKYVDTSGKAYTLESLTGKVVIVNFWATWCNPCKKEIPDLSKLYDAYKDKGVVFLGVMADSPGDSELLNFQSDNEMTYPIVRGNSDLMVAFSYPQALPTTFVYDRGGRMVGRPHVGAISPSDISATLDELVAQK
jgi:thiol-disulfide isomerase/thioredoxin